MFLQGFTFSSFQLGLVVFATMLLTAVIIRSMSKVGQWNHILFVQTAAAILVGIAANYVDSSIGGFPIERQLAGCIFSAIVAGVFMLLFIDEEPESTVHTVKSTDTPPSPKSMWF